MGNINIGKAPLKGNPKQKVHFVIKDGTITTNKIADGAVTPEKLSPEALIGLGGGFVIKIISKAAYESLEEYQAGVLYFVTEHEINPFPSWTFGMSFPITFSSESTSIWTFGSTFPITFNDTVWTLGNAFPIILQ